ncbi:unnamed protein product [Brassica napus]|uniref:(rape) hypothetical protein n=1 Tax=Brassica napus TaxID=3708 RepID=A0A816WAN8_BRANA|nr:unnamed protein product [Brassica napus]
MGSRSQSEDQSTFDPNYTPPNTVDFATQAVLATLAAAAEAGDQIASQEAGVTRADGKQQGSRKRLISLVDDTDDSDVEISQPTQKPSLMQTDHGHWSSLHRRETSCCTLFASSPRDGL